MAESEIIEKESADILVMSISKGEGDIFQAKLYLHEGMYPVITCAAHTRSTQ